MNKTTLRFAVLILIAASLGACATSSATKPANPQVLAKLHTIDKTRATMVIYRPREYMGAALRPPLSSMAKTS